MSALLCFGRIRKELGFAHLVLIHYPASELFIFSLVESLVLDDLIDRNVFESQVLGQLFGVCRFPYTRGTSDHNVRKLARHQDIGYEVRES